MRFKFDRVEGSRVRSTLNGLEIVRRVTVLDIPIRSAATTYLALPEILADPLCPALKSPHPDPRTRAYLEEHQLVTVEQGLRRAELDLVYRALPTTPGGQDVIAWTVTDSSLTNHVTTYMTSAGFRLRTWYKPAEPITTSFIGDIEEPTTTPTGGEQYSGSAHRIDVFRGIRVTGRATRTQWNAVKSVIRGARGKINSDTWGGYTRGKWLFLGPTTNTIDRGNTFDIELTFLEAENGHFPLLWHVLASTGQVPHDISTEARVRALGLPPLGGWRAVNGVTLASIYKETTFTDKFAFSPDDEPNPG